MKIKCSKCGCSKLITTKLITAPVMASNYETCLTIPSADVTTEIDGDIIIYICPKCGHIEFYSNYPQVKIDEEKRKQQFEALQKARHKTIKNLESEFQHLKDIINDENSTVKAVKDAKTKIESVEKELRKFKN